MDVIERTIKAYLPNPQILNFHEATGPLLPDWVGHELRLMMGAGDLCHGGIPNIQLFDTYDVFFCQPWDEHGSLLENVEYLLKCCPRKLLCFINKDDPVHMTRFTTLFAGRFQFIDGHGGHTPHLSVGEAQIVLGKGGVATNMFEGSESVIYYEDFDTWLTEGHFRRGTHNLITARIWPTSGPEGPDDMKTRLIAKMRLISDAAKQVKLGSEMYASLETLTFHELQYITRGLLFESECPPNMFGSWVVMSKDWQKESATHFVLTKRPLDFSGVERLDAAGKARAERLMLGIQADIDRGFLIGSTMKYITFKRLLATAVASEDATVIN